MSELPREDGVQWSREVEGLSIAADQVKSAVSLALDLFLTREDSDDWLVIDRSLLIATAVRDSMRDIYLRLDDGRKRHLIAIALFELGDMSVLPDLIDAVESDQQIFMLAANKLASKSIKQGAPAILRRLESSLGTDATVVATLLRALSRLGNELPQRTYDVLKGNHSPEIQDALTSFSPKV